MAHELLEKDLRRSALPPNLPADPAAWSAFSWDKAERSLAHLPGGGLNIAYEAVDRHAAGPLADKEALRCIARDETARGFTYRTLSQLSNRFANVLAGLGCGKGGRVFALLARVPELYVAALGTLKSGAVFSPLFAAFGPEPVKTRMRLGEARVLVTSERFYQKKVAPVREELPKLEHVLIVDASSSLPEGTCDLARLMAEAGDAFPIPSTRPDDMALLHFTSGTTGTPKGAVHVHRAVLMHHVTGRLALDLHEEDIFWCTADPGWVTGTSYGIVAPLSIGCTLVVDEADFDAERWYRVLDEHAITVWYTAPTAVRMMMKGGAELARRYRHERLRFIASVGEPLNPEAVRWGLEAFDLPIHDNWWQTETGGIMIANTLALPIKPGSMGRPLPGVEAAIVRRDDAGAVTVVDEPGVEGELALRPGWPSMFRGYLGQEERYRRCFAEGWYLSGDLARRDEDGYFWFVGRADDVIKSAGHLIGPFEVESALMEHPAVAEVAVIGKPDPVVGEVVKAFVVLKPGQADGEDRKKDLLGFSRKRLGAAVSPKEIDLVEDIPKTRSGKIMRRLLKARELGLPEGDLSTLEGQP